MPQSSPVYVGLDVHKDSMAVASVAQDHGAEVVSLGNIGTRQGDLDTLIRRLQAHSPQLVFVDEAGPCGAWLYRDLPPQGPYRLGGGPIADPHEGRRSGQNQPS